MEQTYSKLFQFVIQHKYFPSGETWAGLSMAPGDVHLPDLAIKLKLDRDGFFIYAPENFLQTTDLEEIRLLIPFRFSDPQFLNYTDIDNYSPGKIFYLSTDQAVDETLQFAEASLMPLHSSSFTYRLEQNEFDNLSSVAIIDVDEKLKELQIPSIFPPNGFQVDLSGYSEGKYKLEFVFSDGSIDKINYPFFVWNHLPVIPYFAFFECKVSIGSQGINTPYPICNLSINNRAAYIRYLFIYRGTNEEDWESAKVSDIEVDNQTISFKKSETTIQLPSGDKAYFVTSSHPVPLSVRPKWKIVYTSNQYSNGLFLPYPDIQVFKKMSNEGNGGKEDSDAVVTEVFLYL